MGINLFSFGNTQPPNPNPFLKSTIKFEFIGDYSIMEVKYYGCTTFDGRKLLLIKGRKHISHLDPHLLGGGHPVIARFEPNETGWMLARECATILSEESISNLVKVVTTDW